MIINRYKSLLFLLFVFCFALAIPLITATIVVSQPSAIELAKEARSRYLEKDYNNAVKLWQQTATIFAQENNPLNQGMALSNLSLTYQQLGEWEQGKASIEQSLAILKQQEPSPELDNILASSLEIQGKLQLATGQEVLALDSWQEASKIYTNLQDNLAVIRSKINQAQVMQNLGLYPKACKTITSALALDVTNCEITETTLQELTPLENPALQVKALVSLGNILRVMGENELSQQVLLTALSINAISPSDIASVYLALGNTSRSLAQENSYFIRGGSNRGIESINYEQKVADYWQDAEDYYNKAIDSAIEPSTIVQSKVNLLNLLIVNNRTIPPELISEIDSLLATLPTTAEKITIQLNFAHNLLKLQPEINLLYIERIINNAITEAQTLEGNRNQALAYATLGKYYEQKQQWQPAETATKQALSYTIGYNSQDIASQVSWQLGRIYKAENKRQDAINSYTRAYDLLQSLRSDLVATNPDTQFAFRDRIEPLYREFAELLLAPNIEPSPTELAQARQVIESLQLAELDNFFNEACIKANPVQIDKIAPNTAVIYSILLKDRLEVIISLPDGTLLHKSNPTENSLEAVIGELRRNIALEKFPTIASRSSALETIKITEENPSRGIQIIRNTSSQNSNFATSAQELYNWLIAPFTAELEQNQVHTLVFVLDGVLRNIPMAVLQDGEQYLIEKYAIALTPGMQLLEPQPLLRDKFTTLTAGLSAQSPNFPDFSALPNVEQELESIKERVPSKILLNDSFTENNLETKIDAAPFPIVHIATHGNFSSLAEETYILSWDNPINAKELNQVLQGKARSNEPIELLVLSACQTALGDERAVLGLAGVAMRGRLKYF